jgi:hypothetical protein
MVAEAALIIAVAALVLSAMAYGKAGGRRDVESALRYLRAKVEAQGMKELELAGKLYEASRTAFQRTRLSILRARARRAELVISAASAARIADHTGSSRARKLEARAETLMVKAHVLRAQSAAESGELDRAESLLQQAIGSLVSARTILGPDDTHAGAIEERVRSLGNAIAAVRSKAEDAQQHIDEILAGSDSLVNSLETFEDDAGQVVLFVAPGEGTLTIHERFVQVAPGPSL